MLWLGLKYKWLLHRSSLSINSVTLSASVKSAQCAFAKRTLQTVYPSTEYRCTARMLSDMWFYLLVSVVISKRLRSTEKDAVVAQVNFAIFSPRCSFSMALAYYYSFKLFNLPATFLLCLCVVTPQQVQRSRLSK